MGSGNIRQKARFSVNDAFDRFYRSLAPSVTRIDYTQHLSNNYNFSINQLMVHNPMSQGELLEDISKKAAAAQSDFAIAIAFSWRLKTLDCMSDEACENLTGLFLFAVVNLDRRSLLSLFVRCPNIKSLTLAYMDATDAEFLFQAFVEGKLQSLKYIEVSHASDECIAAMKFAPNLSKIVFRFPDKNITDAGFKHLVQGGGGKHLLSIEASVDRSEASKSLSTSFLKAILPRFLSGEGKVRDLVCMSRGNYRAPLATYPLSEISNTGAKKISKVPVKNSGQEMDAEKAKNLAFDVLNNELSPLLEKAHEHVARVQKLQECIFSPDLYPNMSAAELNKALMKYCKDPDVEYKYEKKPYKMRRWELVEALHKYKFRGGGKVRMQLRALEPRLAQQMLADLDRIAKKAKKLFAVAGEENAIVEPIVSLALRNELKQVSKVLARY